MPLDITKEWVRFMVLLLGFSLVFSLEFSLGFIVYGYLGYRF